ncbi:IclR family transcriptional regulator [Euzebya pacifica]|uniref:IclR family transcriptional regulator n=1 Tax=Euzebya pacifica TaxID=1608957 RepID=UPI001C1FFC61|nr:IclR family transcriptional regulator [Euzebya pacifica]
MLSSDPLETSVVGRAFSILFCFDGRRHELSLAEITERVGLPKTTVHRLAAHLLEQGVLERGSAGCYRLGMRLFELGNLVPSQRRLRSTALPFIEDLYEATHQVIHFGVLDDIEVIYLERITGHDGVSCPTRIGGRMPAHCTAVGKAILAHRPEALGRTVQAGLSRRTPHTIADEARLVADLQEIARSGLAYDWQEGQVGVSCVAAPVFNRDGKAVAALSVTSHAIHKRSERFAGAVQATAASLTRTLRHMPDAYWDHSDLSAELRGSSA